MTWLLALIPAPLRLWAAGIAVAAALAFIGWQVHVQRNIGRAEIKLQWDASVAQQLAAALAESTANARESLRRIERQQENQRVQNAQLAAARAAADRNAVDADRVRQQAANSARDWGARLADSPTRADLETAASAIRVCTDLLGRADRRAGILAAHSDASRASGLKCEADYEALTPSTTERTSP